MDASRKILLATDGSDCSYHAIREAMRLLPLEQAQVYLIAVVPDPLLEAEPLIGYGVSAGPTEALLKQAREEVRQHLAEARRWLHEGGITPSEIEREGDAGKQIVEAARELEADLIVLGSHGRNPLARLFVGSVSDAVLRHWEGATMIVRPPKA